MFLFGSCLVQVTLVSWNSLVTNSNWTEPAHLPTPLNKRLQLKMYFVLMYKEKHALCPKPVRNLFKPQSSLKCSLIQSKFSLSSFSILVTNGKHYLRYLGLNFEVS